MKMDKPKTIYINESQFQLLKEDVFVSNLKGNKAQLSYNKRKSDRQTRNIGNYTSFDMLNTGKMDQNNGDTYIVPLKGGIDSYNITSIRGTEVMHYFKNKFKKQKTTINLKVNGEINEFELMMEDPEFQEFIRQFTTKVSNVINYASKDFATKDNNFQGFKGISIYPVPSSSNFNDNMTNILVMGNITLEGMKCQKISSKLFKKDLSNLQKDTDFINKNIDYYNGKFAKKGDDDTTHLDVINDTIRKYKNSTDAHDSVLIDDYNTTIKTIITHYYQYNLYKDIPQKQENLANKIANDYQKLVEKLKKIRAKLGKCRWENTFNKIKYAKGPSINLRTNVIHNIVKDKLGKTYIWKYPIDIVEIEPQEFQMKNLSNDVRMGLKNFFKAQNGMEKELERIEGTVFVIFDDNISGGSTLSDICYQAKKIGIKYIIPITFGEMRAKYQQGTLAINAPEKWNY